MARHRLHGDPRRFDVLAALVNDRWGTGVHYIADVAGGQGMLSRILRKKYNYDSEVVDPRGYVLKGVPNRAEDLARGRRITTTLSSGCTPMRRAGQWPRRV